MHLERDRIRFAPSDLGVFLESEFASWMDRWELERRRRRAGPLPIPGLLAQAAEASAQADTLVGLPLFATAATAAATAAPICEPDPIDEDTAMLQRHGAEHERHVVERWRARGLRVREMRKIRGEAVIRVALRERTPVLYQPLLQDKDFAGRPDFLLLRQGAGRDAWHEPVEAKLARRPRPEHVLQLCAYADLLAPLQNRLPPEIEIVLGDGRSVRWRTDRYVHYARRLRRAFVDFQRDFDPTRMPHPGRSSSHGRWTGCAERIVALTDHLRACAFIHRSQIRKLERAGTTTVAQLALLSLEESGRVGIRAEVLERLTAQARMQVASRSSGRLCYEVRRLAEPDARRGLALLPPESPLDVFFDMEGHPLPEGQLQYLFGAVIGAASEVQFVDWWALHRDAEQRAFEAFVDWVYERWRRDPAMHVYHYNAYEVAALKRLMGLYGSREQEVDDLLRAEVFVDLYRIVRQGLVIGASGYSLKDIEPLYRPARAGTVKTAAGCMAAFERWLDVPDGSCWEESKILAGIRDYNRADCESTRDLSLWLRSVQRQAGIVPAPRRAPATTLPSETAADETPPFGGVSRKSETAARAATRRADRAALGARLLAMAVAATDPDERRVAELLAHLLEFHWRESKPAYWKKYERQAMSEAELYDDLESLAGCVRLAGPEPAPNGVVYAYTFDPDQGCKLAAGDRCHVAGEEDSAVEIVELDADAGRVRLQFKSGTAPERLSIFIDDLVRSHPLVAALERYAAAWADGERMAPAIDDFLRRRPPRITGHPGGVIVAGDGALVPDLARAIGGLDESTLCIQGPPGTGKTYHAARVIHGLLERGCRVGVTANGHKAILNLLAAIGERARESGREAWLVKIRGDAQDPRIAEHAMRYQADNKAAVTELDRWVRAGTSSRILPGIVLGATAWCFARSEMQGRLDYLFVDEAGQLSVANLVAAGLAGRNLVLIGDQMQLAQPLQGSHPGDSGMSALDYLLRGHATIPPDFGVFLGVTHRMHPDICTFVSEAVYDGALHPAPEAAGRRIVPEPALAGSQPLLRRGTGVLWIPVEHRDNAQSSDEEVEAIVRFVRELLRATYDDGVAAVRRMRLEDVLVVAPYNMQVRRLERRLQGAFGPGARVGSVDRFQGLEAPAVVVSMCASTLDDVPRGLEFLLSPHRINVAVSRARCLAAVFGSPAILASRCRSLEDMERLDLYCRLVEHSERQDAEGA